MSPALADGLLLTMPPGTSCGHLLKFQEGDEFGEGTHQPTQGSPQGLETPALAVDCRPLLARSGWMEKLRLLPWECISNLNVMDLFSSSKKGSVLAFRASEIQWVVWESVLF